MEIIILLAILYGALVYGYVCTYNIQDARRKGKFKDRVRCGLDKDFIRMVIVAIAVLIGMIVLTVEI